MKTKCNIKLQVYVNPQFGEHYHRHKSLLKPLSVNKLLAFGYLIKSAVSILYLILNSWDSN